MSSLLTAAEKTAINSALSDVHDTFARDIYIFVKEASSVPAELNYNPLYGRAKNSISVPSTDDVLTKYTFAARIYYSNRQPEDIIDGNAQMNLLASDGKIRIKVTSAAYEKIKICSRIEVDSQLYIVDEDPKVLGPFGAQFYSIYLKREN